MVVEYILALKPVVFGIGAGLAWAGFGFFTRDKNVKTNVKFDDKAFLTTMLYGGIVGAIGGYTGATPGDAELVLISGLGSAGMGKLLRLLKDIVGRLVK